MKRSRLLERPYAANLGRPAVYLMRIGAPGTEKAQSPGRDETYVDLLSDVVDDFDERSSAVAVWTGSVHRGRAGGAGQVSASPASGSARMLGTRSCASD
jgi:hypothetical protein